MEPTWAQAQGPGLIFRLTTQHFLQKTIVKIPNEASCTKVFFDMNSKVCLSKIWYPDIDWLKLELKI